MNEPISLSSLPIEDAIPNLLNGLNQHQAVVLCAPPGSGKTTRIPLEVLKSALGKRGDIVVLEPRRIAARAVAKFMSSTLSESVGETVGYQVRFDKRRSDKTKIHVVTEGILTRRFLSDPFLEGTACVIVDEFHERSINVDLALCFLKETLSVRDDLKVIVMSATLNTDEVSRYLNDCPVVNVAGAPFPLKTIYSESRMPHSSSSPRELVAQIVQTVPQALQEHPCGDILVFLPGAFEIEMARQKLKPTVPPDVQILPLYGALPPKQQDAAITAGNGRRIVLATNIAETSLTIPNVRIVVDSGLEKKMEWRSGIGFEKLVTGKVSQFSATQRAGRAARNGPGTVYRLWSAAQNKELSQSRAPEIQRLDPLATVFTLIASFNRTPERIDLLSQLPETTVSEATHSLKMLGLISDSGSALTGIGKLAIQFPLHPRLALVTIAAAQMNCPQKGALAAAILAERNILQRPPVHPTSVDTCDVQYRMSLIEKFCRQGATLKAADSLNIHFVASKNILQQQEQLLSILQRLKGIPQGPVFNFLLAGFPDRVCQKESPHDTIGTMATGRGIALGSSTLVRSSALFLALDGISDSHRHPKRSEITLASAISNDALKIGGTQFLSTTTEIKYDEATQKIQAFEEERYMALVLRRKKIKHIPPEQKSTLLMIQALEQWKSILFSSPEQKNALARLALAARHCPQFSLPSIDKNGIKPLFEEQCHFVRDLGELYRTQWASKIIDRIPFATQQQLAQLFPTHIKVPSGRRISIDYNRWFEENTAPMIRVKLQELFGLAKTPAIANEQIPLSIALLAPNGREVQITNDLASFWNNTYPIVRKELRARYAKHFWPENPFTATATHLTQKQFARKNKL